MKGIKIVMDAEDPEDILRNVRNLISRLPRGSELVVPYFDFVGKGIIFLGLLLYRGEEEPQKMEKEKAWDFLKAACSEEDFQAFVERLKQPEVGILSEKGKEACRELIESKKRNTPLYSESELHTLKASLEKKGDYSKERLDALEKIMQRNFNPHLVKLYDNFCYYLQKTAEERDAEAYRDAFLELILTVVDCGITPVNIFREDGGKEDREMFQRTLTEKDKDRKREIYTSQRKKYISNEDILVRLEQIHEESSKVVTSEIKAVEAKVKDEIKAVKDEIKAVEAKVKDEIKAVKDEIKAVKDEMETNMALKESRKPIPTEEEWDSKVDAHRKKFLAEGKNAAEALLLARAEVNKEYFGFIKGIGRTTKKLGDEEDCVLSLLQNKKVRTEVDKEFRKKLGISKGPYVVPDAYTACIVIEKVVRKLVKRGVLEEASLEAYLFSVFEISSQKFIELISKYPGEIGVVLELENRKHLITPKGIDNEGYLWYWQQNDDGKTSTGKIHISELKDKVIIFASKVLKNRRELTKQEERSPKQQKSIKDIGGTTGGLTGGQGGTGGATGGLTGDGGGGSAGSPMGSGAGPDEQEGRHLDNQYNNSGFDSGLNEASQQLAEGTMPIPFNGDNRTGTADRVPVNRGSSATGASRDSGKSNNNSKGGNDLALAENNGISGETKAAHQTEFAGALKDIIHSLVPTCILVPRFLTFPNPLSDLKRY